MTIIREERIGNQRLILGDSLQVMPPTFDPRASWLTSPSAPRPNR